jgi:hypothetical protein
MFVQNKSEMFNTSNGFEMHKPEISLRKTIEIILESIALSVCAIVNLMLP